MTKIVVGVLLMALSVATATDAPAASRVCRQLESELAGRSGARYSADKYDAAIERQREQLAVAQDQKENAGCGYSISGRSIRQCAVIARTIEKMNRNLAALQRDRKRASSGAPSRRDRTRILAALEANDCRESDAEQGWEADLAAPPPTEEEAVAKPPKGQLEVMLDENGRRTVSNAPIDGFGASRDPSTEQDARYRTMCVRTCDGYFFPMSSAATVSDFGRDQQNCETACPGTDMRVFYGEMNTDNPSQMVSTTDGTAYAALPTAFRHQQMSLPRVAGCGCNASKDFEITAGAAGARQNLPSGPAAIGTKAIESEKSSSIVTIPPPEAPVKPAHKQLDTVGSSDAAVEHDPPARNVRVVGPEFLPDPKAAIDLRAPAQKSGP